MSDSLWPHESHTARQASLSITISQSSLTLTSIESVIPSSHLILCRPLLLLPPIPPSTRVFSNESILPIWSTFALWSTFANSHQYTFAHCPVITAHITCSCAGETACWIPVCALAQPGWDQIFLSKPSWQTFLGGSVVKKPPAKAGATGWIPHSGRSPGKGNGNPLQYSCLENPKDRGAWWTTVHGIAESGTT